MLKKLLHLILLLTLGIFFFNSCRKEFSNESGSPINPPQVKPDLSSKITASVNGFITDENNNAVSGAVITASTKTATTGKFGYFKISDAQLGKTAAFIKVEKAGYFTGYRTFLANEGKETFIRLKLIPKKDIGTVNAIIGGTVATTDGASVTLPANGVMVAASGAAYTGTVHVASHWINPAGGNELQTTMPGNLEGIDTAGYLKGLVTFGMMAVELTGDAGEILQVANSNQAALSFPIPPIIAGASPSTIPLWWFNENTGLWQQEGIATKIANSYVGNVKHFSYWNCDIGMPLVNFICQVVDGTLNPLDNTQVSVSIANMPNSARVDYTDTAGFVSGRIIANRELALGVMATPCGISAYSKTFTTAANDIDLGVITTNTVATSANITGTVVDCNQQPVAQGYVVISNSYNSVAHIQNGMFNLNTMTCGNPNSASVVAFDIATLKQSDAQTVTLTSGINNIGSLITCSTTDTLQYVIYTLDNITTTIAIPPNKVMNAGQYNNDTITQFYIYNDVQGQVFQAHITGKAVADSNHFIYNGIGIPDPFSQRNGFGITTPLRVYLTSYGPVGDFISGNFSGQVHEINTNIPHNFNCTFRIRRQH